ncbi:TetR/AcrR family transcriptional regulator [Mycolicibacterium baixiangningiae]|uniref:TetR/AcrR family transcriptional regulator n=1 Tax=Mycolicibacterium baixiangningiae TaxID=2761578 RepID=UPI0018663F6A|nr:TetR/AcrR family transcriptional regulator [Mycolicibacterium baixiangningiae]
MKSGTKAPMGRPRAFDADEALDRAMRVFWEQGYEGASLTDLTEAMGISRTSMYAAFGNKEELFARVLQRYTEGPASYGPRALEEPTARHVAAAVLRGAITASTSPGGPAGCLGVQGALAAGAPAREVRDLLIAWRNDGVSQLRRRFQLAVDEGDLPCSANPGVLARYIVTLSNGIAVQAASGASRDDLQQVADAALRSWPPA